MIKPKLNEKTKLEDIYLPYKPKRTTKATIAKQKGLEPLAQMILAQDIMVGKKVNKDEIVSEFLNKEKGVLTVKDALTGAIDIIAEQISDNALYRGLIRNFILTTGVLKSKVKKGLEDQKTKFEMYYDYSEPIKAIVSHRILAIRRGAKEGILTWKIDVDSEQAIETIASKIVKDFKPDIAIGFGGYVSAPVIMAAHSYKVKVMIHEQNSIPGLSNKLLIKKVKKICVSLPGSVKYFPEDAELNYNIGILHEKMKDFEKAKIAYEKAIAISPQEDFYYNLGEVLVSLELWDEAIDAFKTVLKTDSKDGNCFFNISIPVLF